MLRDLTTESNNLDEEIECVDLSFTIERRNDNNEDVVRQRYTFSHAKEWEKWVFTKFEEYRASADVRVNKRNWRRSQKITWEEDEARDITVPSEVNEQLAAMLDADNFVIQEPSRRKI